MTIFKYTLKIADKQVLNLPMGAEILCVQIQNGQPQLWARVDEQCGATDQRTIEIFDTGHPMDIASREYIGTVQEMSESLVWHVFERL